MKQLKHATLFTKSFPKTIPAIIVLGAAVFFASCGDPASQTGQGQQGAPQANGGQAGNFQGGNGQNGTGQGAQGNRAAGQNGGNFQGGQGGNFQGGQGGNFAGGQAGNFQGGQGGNFQGRQGGGQGGNFQGGGQGGQFGGQGGQGRFAAITVEASAVQVGNLMAERQTAGTISAVTESQVAATASGVVSRVIRSPGDWVKRGDLIIQLDDSQPSLSLRNAQASLDNANINLSVGEQNNNQAGPRLDLQLQSATSALAAAQKNYDATEQLYKLGGNSGADLDNAKAQLQTAQANLEAAKISVDQNKSADTQNLAQLRIAVTQATIQVEQARLNLSNTSIRAPFDGQISAIKVKQGEYLGQNSPAIVLVSADRQISFAIAPDDAARLSKGAAVIFTYNGQAYPAKILQTPPAPTNGTVALTARADGIASLSYGSIGTVSYNVALANGTLMPLAALQASGSKTIAYTVEGNKAKLREVKVLAQAGTMVAVEGNLDGRQVIMNPPPGLVDGATVTLISTNGAKVQANAPVNQGQGQNGQTGRGAGATGQNTGQNGNYQGRRQGGQSGQSGSYQGATGGSSQGQNGQAGQGGQAGQSGGNFQGQNGNFQGRRQGGQGGSGQSGFGQGGSNAGQGGVSPSPGANSATTTQQ